LKTEPSLSGLTRRSFIKRSVVAAVATSSMTIFSGLVNAAEEYDSCVKGLPCVLEMIDTGIGNFIDGQLHWIAECRCDTAGCCQRSSISCYDYYASGETGALVKVKVHCESAAVKCLVPALP